MTTDNPWFTVDRVATVGAKAETQVAVKYGAPEGWEEGKDAPTTGKAAGDVQGVAGAVGVLSQGDPLADEDAEDFNAVKHNAGEAPGDAPPPPTVESSSPMKKCFHRAATRDSHPRRTMNSRTDSGRSPHARTPPPRTSL